MIKSAPPFEASGASTKEEKPVIGPHVTPIVLHDRSDADFRILVALSKCKV